MTRPTRKAPRTLSTTELRTVVGGAVMVNPLYQDAGTSASNPLWPAEAALSTNPMYRDSGMSGVNAVG